MNKRWIGLAVGLILVGMMTASSPTAFSQMEKGQPVVYTYVSQFQVPRASWAQYSENAEKTFVPLAEKMVADGTILSYSTFEPVVHTPDGYTHGAAWTSNSIAGLTKVLDELRKGAPQPGQIAATKHEDFLMQTSTYVMGTGGGAAAYLRVVCQNAKPDKPDAYAGALKKYLWPTFEEQVKKGVANYVGLDTQYVNTSAPSARCLVISYPNAENMDKWAAAINATLGKMSPADREAFYATTVPDSRRDMLARITHSGHK
ncbi:MAG TPA: hypothetical protein VFI45_09375 [Candidatus Acidoferrum sp.]|nr:hypothetical protein [Candidatus Acidoferrum sp.]